MHKYILIPDSFKGTLSARDFCAVAREAIGRADPGAQVLSIPLADGGEGTVEAFLAACGGQRIECPCTGPYGGTAPGFYGLLPDGTAVVELAAAAGLPLAGTDLHPADATTYGVGQLLLHAARHGARRLLLGLGGSATNDGGCGAAAALGVEFYDRRGRTFVPTGGTLGDIHRISAENLEPLPPVTVLCDVDNPLCGPRGAAAVFGPQKGADPDMVQLLDAGLAHLAAVLRRDTGRDVLDMPGGGAAGGFGAGAAALLNARLRPGVEMLLDAADFPRLAADADLIITGEGRLDSQSLGGKAVIGVAGGPGSWEFPARPWPGRWTSPSCPGPMSWASPPPSPSILCPCPLNKCGFPAGKICPPQWRISSVFIALPLGKSAQILNAKPPIFY